MILSPLALGEIEARLALFVHATEQLSYDLFDSQLLHSIIVCSRRLRCFNMCSRAVAHGDFERQIAIFEGKIAQKFFRLRRAASGGACGGLSKKSVYTSSLPPDPGLSLSAVEFW